MIKRLIVLPVCLCFAALQGYSQSAPKYSNDFLDIGVSARALAMGNSVIASVDDVTSGYWNPAGLLGIKSDLEISLMHNEYFAGIAKYDYGAASYRIDKNSVFGLTIIRFGIDNIPNTIDLIDPTGEVNYNNITSFSDAQYAFLFSYARSFDQIPNLGVGANIKVIRTIVGSFAGSWGFGFDAGAQYKLGDYQFGAMARDITSTFNAWSYNLSQDMLTVFEQTGNEIPENHVEVTLPRLLLDAARKLSFFSDKFTVMPELGMDMTFDGKRNTIISTNPVSVDPHIGMEFGYKSLIFLRLGMSDFQNSTNEAGDAQEGFTPAFGVGLKIKSFSLDYALTDNTTAGLYSNVFSLKFDINKKGTR